MKHHLRWLLLASVALPILFACALFEWTYITLQPENPESASPASLRQAAQILQERYSETLSGRARVTVQGNALQVALSRPEDQQLAIELASQRGEIIFFESEIPLAPGVDVPPGAKIIMTNVDIGRAEAEMIDERWSIAIEFSEQGSQKIAAFSRDHIGQYLIIAQDGVVISSPSIETPILDGQALISGDFDQRVAEAFAAQLNSLPLPFLFLVVDQ